MSGSQISTHILDTAAGHPATGVAVVLEAQTEGTWAPMASGITDENGRVTDLGPAEVAPGVYLLRFATGAYFQARSTATFFPEVSLTFTVANSAEHYHVPLLISPFAYSTYRGN
ncbi:MAG: hydroxyisourate hydrolase [Lacisediminihabitans sp.]